MIKLIVDKGKLLSKSLFKHGASLLMKLISLSMQDTCYSYQKYADLDILC